MYELRCLASWFHDSKVESLCDRQGAWDSNMTKEQSATIFGLTAVLSSKQKPGLTTGETGKQQQKS